MSRRVLLVILLVALAVGAAWLAQRRRGDRDPPRRADAATVLARDRAAAEFSQASLTSARAALAPLVAKEDAELEDLVRAAVVEFHDKAAGMPEPFFERIRARDPSSPALAYMLGRTALDSGAFEAARRHFAAVLAELPDDLPSRLGVATALTGLGRESEAETILREVVALGVAQAGTWYVQAVYRLMLIAELAEREEQAQHYGDLFRQLERLGYRSSTAVELDSGNLAVVLPATPQGNAVPAPAALPELALEPALLPELASARELLAVDLEGDGDVDWLASVSAGVVCAVQGTSGLRAEPAIDGAVERVLAFDLGNDDTLDLLAARGEALLLFEARSGADLLLRGKPGALELERRWSREPIEIARLPAPPSDLLVVDYDHEGDLDVLAVGPFGARLFRNDGAAPRAGEDGALVRGSFTEVSSEARLPRDRSLAWCATEDFDNDHDVDLLLGGPEALFLMDSRRSEGFADIAGEAFGGSVRLSGEPLIADLDGDARPDLLERGSPAVVRRQRADGTFERERAAHAIPDDAELAQGDLDLDGALDLVWAAPGAPLRGMQAFGLPGERAFELATTAQGALACADIDGDLDNDLALSTQAGLEFLRCSGPVGHAARIQLHGLKDNRRGVGAVVEARSRELYRRIYWRGEAQLVACGPHAALDVLRITWPNGVVQSVLDVPPTAQALLDTRGAVEQSGNAAGSCPFLYAWNGSSFAFITDVLGGTPLGLPMAPGMLVPPDHDEFVLVRGDQLVERDGFLELQLTEELREVTYLDRARLDVVDHPAGTEIQPNERFTFPPFPEPHVHAARELLAPRTALGSDGRDWAAELAAEDDDHALPFAPLGEQLTGLAEPYWLELEFDPERVRGAARLRLFCTGWFRWSDASVNLASARTPGVQFLPPVLQVRGSEGEWVDAGPPVGFPAGKTKTMVLDVSAIVPRDDPRIRLRSTLCLYWDRIQLALDADDAPLEVHALEAAGAELWSRGFSAPLATGQRDLPERFEWGALIESKPWDQHPGRYTRYGEVKELLAAIDDRFVILGSGDALTLRFDARELPPLAAGQERDYLLFLDGWAKDRDPNTVEALEVEPLPFHAMSGYPYAAEERFPDGPEHRAWRAEWNTREARRWIVPLAPAREVEWALSAPAR
jgi:tetratricopeptide (TPR) repeat protein